MANGAAKPAMDLSKQEIADTLLSHLDGIGFNAEDAAADVLKLIREAFNDGYRAAEFDRNQAAE